MGYGGGQNLLYRRFRHLQELFLKGIRLNFASFWGKESPRRFFVSTSLKTRKENEFSFQACGLCAPFPLVRERKTKMTWHVCHFLKRGNLMATAAKHLQKFFAELFFKKATSLVRSSSPTNQNLNRFSSKKGPSEDSPLKS